MSTPYIGEIRMFGGNFAPAGWAFCDGSVLAIADNDVLFLLIGTTYGGDGQLTFNLPDLRGRLPMHMGTGPGLSTRTIGESGGVESVPLTTPQIPIHTHAMVVSASVGHLSQPGGAFAATHRDYATYTASTPTQAMAASIGAAGGNQPHANLAPYTCVSFIISLFGVFPSQ